MRRQAVWPSRQQRGLSRISPRSPIGPGGRLALSTYTEELPSSAPGGLPSGLPPHVRPERRHRPPDGSGLRRKALRKVRKSLAGRYYQLTSGHTTTGSFLHERMTGPIVRSRASAGGAAAGRESHATISSRSARPGPLKSEGCGSEWKGLRVRHRR